MVGRVTHHLLINYCVRDFIACEKNDHGNRRGSRFQTLLTAEQILSLESRMIGEENGASKTPALYIIQFAISTKDITPLEQSHKTSTECKATLNVLFMTGSFATELEMQSKSNSICV